VKKFQQLYENRTYTNIATFRKLYLFPSSDKIGGPYLMNDSERASRNERTVKYFVLSINPNILHGDSDGRAAT
jgi:hypothetical protein